MLTVGMLWLGTEPESAISYFIKKNDRKPNEVECNPSHPLLEGKKSKQFEGYSLVSCKSIGKGNLLVGCKEDTDLSKYKGGE